MTTAVSGPNSAGNTAPAGAPSIDLRRMPVGDAMNIVVLDASGNPSVDPAMAAEFARLPVDQQTAFLQRWLATAKTSTDPALKMAVTTVTSQLANQATAPALRADHDAILGQLSAMPAHEVPPRIPSAAAHGALTRLRAGTATAADYSLLVNAGNHDMLPADRAAVARHFAARSDGNSARQALENAPSRAAANAALGILGRTVSARDARGVSEVDRGLLLLNTLIDRNLELDDALSGDLSRTQRRLEGLGTAGRPPLMDLSRQNFEISTTIPAVAPADVTADDGAAAPPGQSVDSSGLAPPPIPTRDLSEAEKQQHFERARAAAAADGTLSIGDQFLLIEAALDPHQYYNRLMGSDPDLILQLKDNPGLLESVKTVVAAMNAAKDALSAIHDDVNQRRKKAAESLSRA